MRVTSVLAFASGAVALVYELAWLRLFSDFFGVTLYATGAVLAAYLGGLALGAHLAARRADGLVRPLRAYAALEAIAALGAAAVVVALPSVAAGWRLVGAASDGALIGAGRFAVAFVVVGAPTAALGATLPVLVRAATVAPVRRGDVAASLYAANTLGAVTGTVLSGFALLPALGAVGSGLAASAGGLVVAGVALALDARHPSTPTLAPDAPRSPVASAPTCGTWALVSAGLTGFAALGYEVVWMRVVSTITKDTVFAFTVTLACFLGGSALGSAVVARRSPPREARWALLGAVQVAVALWVLASPRGFRWWDERFARSDPPTEWFDAAVLEPLTVAALMVGPPAALLGASVALLFGIVAVHDGAVGAAVGRVYAANTVGAIAGSVVASVVLVPRLGVLRATVVLAIVSVAVAAVAYRRQHLTGGRLPRLAELLLYFGVPAAAVAALAVLQAPLDAYYAPGATEGRRQVFAREDATGLVEIFEEPGGALVLVTDRTHRWGSTDVRMVRSMRRQGYLPLVLHPRPARIVEVGLGTGATLTPASLHAAVERIDVVEISPAIVEAARRFGPVNGELLESPKVSVTIADGKNHLLLTRDQYDVIVLGLFVPDRPGAGQLFSRELYVSCRSRLLAGGIVVQWLPLDQLVPDSVRSVLATFQSVFAETHLFEKGHYLAMVGSHDVLSLDVARARRVLAAPSLQDDAAANGLTDARRVLSTYVGGPQVVRRLTGDAPLNTATFPRVELQRTSGGTVRSYGLAATNLDAVLAQRTLAASSIVGATSEEQTALLVAFEARGHALGGAVAQARGRHRDAVESFRRALALDPGEEIARAELERYRRAVPRADVPALR